jgi:hypothetical protein
MDCGNKAVTVETNSECWVLQKEEAALVAVNVRIDNKLFHLVTLEKMCI